MLQPGDRLDQFRIERVLGHGVFGATYQAMHVISEEQVTLKVPAPESMADAETSARFQSEKAIALRLRHANIQGPARSFVDRNAPFLALEYLDGQSLRGLLEENPGQPLPVAQAVAIARQVAAGLRYAHANAVVHRDLKPENLIVLPDGWIKIIDFGSARLAGLRQFNWHTRGEAPATPDYMAPEQIEGGSGDARTDLYALGVILFELLAGDVPFLGDNPNAVLYQHVHSEPPALRDVRPEIPERLSAIIGKALQKSPHERYQSAAEILHDLEQYDQSLEPPVVPTQSAASGWSRWLPRRPRSWLIHGDGSSTPR